MEQSVIDVPFLNIWIILAAVAGIAAPLLYQLASINGGFITHKL